MTILDKIIAQKKITIAASKAQHSIKDFEQNPLFSRDTYSFRAALQDKSKLGIIAEFKRHSPSQGDIHADAKIEEVTQGYAEAGASALSILTDTPFFKGTKEDLMQARQLNTCPVLRKDFIIDEYQIFEAKSIGADVILLIAECLTKEEVGQLARCAKSLGLEILMEVHSEKQLDKLVPEIDVVGINNRNLETFEVSIQHSIDLYEAIPSQFLKISESGISNPNAIYDLRRIGFDGFLIGEYFMRAEQPHQKLKEFIQRVYALEDLLNNAIA
ncbi:MAG: indole-3-glycerol phosphate synthase TrpC [Bacteroidota bacterium]